MKWIAILLFAAAFATTIGWFNATERGLTVPQQSAIGIVAIAGWLLTFAFAAMAND